MFKTLKITAATLLLALGSGAAFAQTPDTETPDVASQVDLVEGRTIIAQVNGMVCDFCAQSLTKVLKKKDAVDDVSISLETKLITITLKDGKSLTDEEVREAVTWAGYETVSIERA